jgi:hypothetical protein
MGSIAFERTAVNEKFVYWGWEPLLCGLFSVNFTGELARFRRVLPQGKSVRSDGTTKKERLHEKNVFDP